MSDVRETRLPGVGIRYDFTTDEKRDIGVLVHHDGRREVVVYDEDDPDRCSSLVHLSESDSQTLGEILGVSHVAEAVSAVRQEIEGLSIEWVTLTDDAPVIGTTIGDGAYRSRTGSSIVAIMRGAQPVPAPGPDFELAAGDTVVAVGTPDGLADLRRRLTI